MILLKGISKRYPNIDVLSRTHYVYEYNILNEVIGGQEILDDYTDTEARILMAGGIVTTRQSHEYNELGYTEHFSFTINPDKFKDDVFEKALIKFRLKEFIDGR